jgi:hypothetical protein
MPARGRTGVGRTSKAPHARYIPPSAASGVPIGLTIHFQGEDNRERKFDVSKCASPGWHDPLAAVLATRMGPAGTWRTLASARAIWDIVRIFMSFLEDSTKATVPERLCAKDVEDFLAWRRSVTQEATATSQLRYVAAILRTSPLRERISIEAMAELTRRRPSPHRPGKPSYSAYELRCITRIARRDVSRIRNRLEAGERLLAASPASDTDNGGVGEWNSLAALAATGVVPDRVGAITVSSQRTAEARRLFLTWPDMTSLLALFVVVSGRNVETIKELPVEHRILNGRAVELRLTKRRRGRQRWHETVTWEIGSPTRQLFTPGGLYLLVHQLCARGRAFSKAETIWSLWRNHQPGEVASIAEHVNPFANGLHKNARYTNQWHSEGLIDQRTGQPLRDARGELLHMDFQRLRTAVEVRRVRAMGGHLPSAARSNTAETLYGSYLRDDPSTREWAQEIIDQALLDAASVLDPIVEGSSDDANNGNATTTAWAACRNTDRHPDTGAACEASFLECFGCANCVITREHLPAIVGLRAALIHRRRDLPESAWLERYGQAWTAIRRDVLPRFTPAEVAAAGRESRDDALLDLVEPGWERM